MSDHHPISAASFLASSSSTKFHKREKLYTWKLENVIDYLERLVRFVDCKDETSPSIENIHAIDSLQSEPIRTPHLTLHLNGELVQKTTHHFNDEQEMESLNTNFYLNLAVNLDSYSLLYTTLADYELGVLDAALAIDLLQKNGVLRLTEKEVEMANLSNYKAGKFTLKPRAPACLIREDLYLDLKRLLKYKDQLLPGGTLTIKFKITYFTKETEEISIN